MRILILITIIFMFTGCDNKKVLSFKPEIAFVHVQGEINKSEVSFKGIAQPQVKRIEITDETCTQVFKKLKPRKLEKGSYLDLVEGINTFYLQVYYKNGTKRCFNKSPLAVFTYVPLLDVEVKSINAKFVVKNLTTQKDTDCLAMCTIKVHKNDKIQVIHKNEKLKGDWSKGCGILRKGCYMVVKKPERIEFTQTFN